MKHIATFLFVMLSVFAYAQPTVIGTIPFNGPMVGGERQICVESGRAGQVEDVASGITLAYTIPTNCTTFSGVATTDTAFVSETFAGGAMAVQGFTNGGSYNFDFTLGGTSLGSYREFEIYFQARVSSKNTATNALSLQYAVNGGAFQNVGSTNFRNSSQWESFTFTLPSDAGNPSGNLVFRIVATGGPGASNTATLRIDNVQVRATLGGTVARDQATGAELRVYPNPANNQVHVQLLQSLGTVALSLVDVQGSVVRSQQFEGTTSHLNVEGLAPGIYTLLAETAQGSLRQRVVVQR
jgi:hypothetical protein